MCTPEERENSRDEKEPIQAINNYVDSRVETKANKLGAKKNCKTCEFGCKGKFVPKGSEGQVLWNKTKTVWVCSSTNLEKNCYHSGIVAI